MNKKLLISIFTVLIIGLFALPALAQSPVQAQIDRADITSDDVLILTVTIDESNGRAAEPQLGGMDGFVVQGRSSSSQISIINGSSSRQKIYQYSLVPTQLGTLTIAPVMATVGGQQYTTEPIAVNVAQGNGRPSAPPASQSPFGAMPNINSLLGSLGAMGTAAAPSTVPTENPAPAPAELAGKAFYVEAEIDNANPYQGEQIVHTFRFYQAENLRDQPTYKAPDFTGFWSVENDGQTEHTVEAGGHAYRVTQIETILFPTVVGELAITPAELNVPGDFFAQGMGLQTEALTVNVKPLPENAPAGFNGAVGQFRVQTAVDTAESTVNDTVNWLIRLSGAGNIEQLPEPIWPEGDEWRSFDSEATMETEFAADYLIGSKVYERVMIPTTPGELTLPAVEYVYFNPKTEAYETAVSDPIIISVLDDGSAIAPNAITPVSGNDGQPLVEDEALRPLKPATKAAASTTAPLTDKAGYWLLWLLPLFVLGGNTAVTRYRRYRADNTDARRSQQAQKQAVRALKQAGTAAASAEAGAILTAYLSAKLNLTMTGMTQTAVGNLLQAHGADEALAIRVQSCLTAGEMGRYAPSGTDAANENLLTETEQLINDLEAVIE